MKMKDVVDIFERVYETEKLREELRQLFIEIFETEPDSVDIKLAKKAVVVYDPELEKRLDDIYKLLKLSIDKDFYEIQYFVEKVEYVKPDNFKTVHINGREWYVDLEYPEMVHLPKQGFVARVVIHRQYNSDC